MRRLLALLALCAGAPATAQETHALVIGIDAYDHLPDLQGAVNDARDIAAALEESGAEVTLLLDGAATRAAVLAAWRGYAERLGPGDRLVVSYAGHGSNEPEHTPGNEADGRDENFLLAGFSPYGADAAERLRDDEIAGLIESMPGVDLVFIADSCHSGTVSREIAPALGYRYYRLGELVDDPLPPPPPRPAGSGDGQDGLALFIGAVDESQKVPEYLIDGTARGALSLAFAEAVRGAADGDGDTRLTRREIEEYVRRRVRQISQGVQHPQVAAAARPGDMVLRLRDDGATAAAPPGTLPVLSLALTSAAARPLSDRPVRAVAPGAPADLVLDPDSGVLRSDGGDLLAVLGPATAPDFVPRLARQIDKFRVLAALDARSGPLTVRFRDGDVLHRPHQRVTTLVEGRRTRWITLLSLDPEGRSHLVYPVREPALGIDDPAELPATEPVALALDVVAPFGAEALIAVESPSPPTALRRELAALDGRLDPVALWQALTRAEADASAIGLFAFYSTGH